MKRYHFGLLFLTVIVGCSESPSQPENPSPDLSLESGPAIPKNYVITPNGLYHRSCVHQIEDGAQVGKDRVVRRRNGTHYPISKCAYPKYPVQTRPLSRSGMSIISPTNGGWIESLLALSSFPGTFRKLTANWNVPPNPVGYYSSGMVYFTFPGLDNGTFIIQPVLQYGNNGSYGGNWWTIASWHCDDGDDCVHSTPQTAVAAGNALNGLVEATNCSGGTCTWTITTKVVSTGVQSVLTLTDNDNYNEAVGGAVEVQGINDCYAYPHEGVVFSSIAVYNQNNSQVTPSWSQQLQTGATPFCDFSVSNTSTSVNLYHSRYPLLNSLATNPSPPKRYLPFSVTLTGVDFDPATVRAVITGSPSSSCPTACYIENSSFSSKSATQLYAPYFSLSILGTYDIRVQNGTTGYMSPGTLQFTIVP